MNVLDYGPAWLSLAWALMLVYAIICVLTRPEDRPRPYDWERDGL